MILTWIKDGIEYSLDDGAYCYHHGNEGMGAAPLVRYEEQGPLQHGATDTGFNLVPRVMQLILGLFAESEEELDAKREALVDLFAPSVVPGALRVQVGSKIRQIDCHRVEGLEYMSSDQKGYWLKTGVVLRAPDPSWYDPAGEAISIYSAAGGGAGFTVPLPVPHEVGSSALGAVAVIDYQGSWMTFPVIRIYGPITDPVINNLTTGLKLDFTGLTISTGDWYEIDTRYGYKTVVDQDGVRQVSKLTDDSDLADFHIQRKTTNQIQVSGSATSSGTRIELTWFTRYEGR